jgi:Mg-chelatase subunit ChlD
MTTNDLMQQTTILLDRATSGVGTRHAPAIAGAVRGRAAGPVEHIVLLTDRSGSMGEPYMRSKNKIDATRDAAVSLVTRQAQIDERDRIAVVAFNDRAQTLIDLTSLDTGREAIAAALLGITAAGGTDFTNPFKLAEQHLAQIQGNRRIIFLTDGQASHPGDVVDRLKGMNTQIDVIGIGPTPASVNEGLLRRIASTIEGRTHYEFIADAGTLIAGFTSLAGKSRLGGGGV